MFKRSASIIAGVGLLALAAIIPACSPKNEDRFTQLMTGG